MKRVNPSSRIKFLNFRDDKTIHLGIQTNILCVDDRIEAKYLGRPLQDFTATLYLGKIVFEKNKKGILAPKFIPSKIADSSFEGLNTFWLNEINKKAKKPFRSLIKCERIKMAGTMCLIDSDSIPYQKIHYFRHKDNIILTKEQIISYFTQLHQENTGFIANYIESINKNNGIKAYHLHDKIYDDLLSKGILQKDMFKWWSNAPKAPYTQAILLTLDFLVKTNQPNHKILLYDELFYAYLVWSLREFLIPYFSGRFQDENHLLFNAGAYKKYIEKFNIGNPHINKFEGLYIEIIFYENILPTKHNVGYVEGYEIFFKYHGPNFLPIDERYAHLNLPKSKGYEQYSPNIDMSDFCNDKEPCSLREDIFNKITKVKPSPLGKYYFELSDNKSVYIEFFPRIYPSITNLPKGWSKEMMQKLDLKLE
ncbi:hypothetical protein [Helicobacter sp. T3_23-1059]